MVAVDSWPSHRAITAVSMPTARKPHRGRVPEGVHSDAGVGQFRTGARCVVHVGA